MIMRRRELIALLGSAPAWPFAARAQQRAIPVIGFLNIGSPDTSAHLVPAFRQGLGEIGIVEGRNATIEYRWANGQYGALPALAAELVRRDVAVIAALGTAAPGLAAKTATATIPIIFTSGDDPVKAGLVSSLNLPGGNITGVHLFLTALNAKKLGLLHDLLPQATTIAVCVNPSSQNAETQATEMQAAGRALGLRIEIVNASNEREIDKAFTALAARQVGAVVVSSDPFYLGQRKQLIELAARHSIPAVYALRAYVAEGGLMSYGTSISDAYRQAGAYVGRILKGEKPADLPVVQSTKFEMTINLKTSKALGLTFPSGLLAIADEVIE
jgi:putative ABC transport system substrate-binding protein